MYIMNAMNTPADNKRKELHYLSIGMFALIALKIVDLLSFLMNVKDIDTTGMDAAAPAAISLLNGIVIAISAIGIIVLAILGVKGLMEAKKPTAARFHITLAFVACIFFAAGTVIEITELFKSADLFDDIGSVLISGLFFIDTLSYGLAAKAVRVNK